MWNLLAQSVLHTKQLVVEEVNMRHLAVLKNNFIRTATSVVNIINERELENMFLKAF